MPARRSSRGTGRPSVAGDCAMPALGGTISLENRVAHGHIGGLDTTVRLPLAENPA